MPGPPNQEDKSSSGWHALVRRKKYAKRTATIPEWVYVIHLCGRHEVPIHVVVGTTTGMLAQLPAAYPSPMEVVL